MRGGAYLDQRSLLKSDVQEHGSLPPADHGPSDESRTFTGIRRTCDMRRNDAEAAVEGDEQDGVVIVEIT
eukprot:1183719-Prorocentrum_minimum.AAC.3